MALCSRGGSPQMSVTAALLDDGRRWPAARPPTATFRRLTGGDDIVTSAPFCEFRGRNRARYVITRATPSTPVGRRTARASSANSVNAAHPLRARGCFAVRICIRTVQEPTTTGSSLRASTRAPSAADLKESRPTRTPSPAGHRGPDGRKRCRSRLSLPHRQPER